MQDIVPALSHVTVDCVDMDAPCPASCRSLVAGAQPALGAAEAAERFAQPTRRSLFDKPSLSKAVTSVETPKSIPIVMLLAGNGSGRVDSNCPQIIHRSPFPQIRAPSEPPTATCRRASPADPSRPNGNIGGLCEPCRFSRCLHRSDAQDRTTGPLLDVLRFRLATRALGGANSHPGCSSRSGASERADAASVGFMVPMPSKPVGTLESALRHRSNTRVPIIGNDHYV